METITISFDLTSTDYSRGLGFEVFSNNKQILNIDHVRSNSPVRLTLDVEEGDQQLRFVMKNKIGDWTTVDDDGKIIKDACLNISDFTIDCVELGHTFLEKSKYHHDFNGTRAPVAEYFNGAMGCNGEVRFEFQSPVYLWLVTNM